MMKSNCSHSLNGWLKKNSGFTFIELTFVVVVVGLLMSMAYKKYSGVTEWATKKSANYDDAIRKQKVERDLAVKALGLTPAPAFDPPPKEFVNVLAAEAEK